jgi:hypothetical protein
MDFFKSIVYGLFSRILFSVFLLLFFGSRVLLSTALLPLLFLYPLRTTKRKLHTYTKQQ